MSFQPFVYQPTKQESLYEEFIDRQAKMYQLRLQQDKAIDEYSASIMRDPNFSKDSPYNPYINQKLQETLATARAKYQNGELNSGTFRSYVANQVGKINLWVQNSDQIMKSIDESVAYYKTKGADVSSIKNRAARQIFMNEDGSWKDGDVIAKGVQDGSFATVVDNVVESSPQLAFKDTKAVDDWLNTVKTERENITKEVSTIVGGQKGKTSQASTLKGVADFYPMWQQVSRNADGIPTGVTSKTIPIDQIKANDALYYSAKAAIHNQRLNNKQFDDGTTDKITVSDQEIANWVTDYANIKRPYNFTKDEEKATSNVVYKTTVVTGDQTGKDYNIFNSTFKGTLPDDRFFTGSGSSLTLRPNFTNQLKVGKRTVSGVSVDVYPQSITMDKANKSITVKMQDGGVKTYTAGTSDYAAFMTDLESRNPQLSGWGSSQPELKGAKQSGFRTNF